MHPGRDAGDRGVGAVDDEVGQAERAHDDDPGDGEREQGLAQGIGQPPPDPPRRAPAVSGPRGLRRGRRPVRRGGSVGGVTRATGQGPEGTYSVRFIGS